MQASIVNLILDMVHKIADWRTVLVDSYVGSNLVPAVANCLNEKF